MLFEGVIEFISGLTLQKALAYFWPFFLLDMTRYVFLDLIALLVYIPGRIVRRPLYSLARHRLFQERPLVSVLVPGKNEGKHIPRLAASLKDQSYKNLELIVVDDGTDDGTEVICRRLAGEGKIHTFIRNNVRGGKASAANTALRYSHGKYLVHIDADSHLASNAIETILIPFFMDERIGAVGGDVRVSNAGESFATRLQAIEYIKAISTGRTVSSQLGILRIIAGAHGAFRRDILERIHGWDVGQGLDGDITIKIRKLGFRVIHEPEAACYTNVPDTFTRLARQRFRWDRSMVRFRVRKHRDIFLPSASFTWLNFITSAENIFFNLLLDIKWWIYIVQIAVSHPEALSYLFIINYVLYLMANIIEFMMGCILLRKSLHARDYLLFLFLPLIPIYTGTYLRIIRTYAYLMEFLTGASYRDPWNPWKVSKEAKREGL